SLGVLVPGTPGRALANADEIAQAWFDALVSHQAGTVTAAFASTGFGTVPVPAAAVHPGVVHAGHWVDVDLTRQMAILFDGTEAVRAFIISSGAPGHETPTGHFRVYARVASQTIAGDGYRYDNVKWCVWFQGNYGFHTAYWHDDFGQPVSHGCLNMREADAKAVYDWVSLGSDIEIHT
ncbi:MAG: L,D-transpeptidase, partial [Actinomycetia bacterium]|nr:L,D-transpeptidase [Actinomycetes bacterium]